MIHNNILITNGLYECGQPILCSGANLDDRTGIFLNDTLKLNSASGGLTVHARSWVTVSVMKAGPYLKVVGRANVCVNNIDLDAAERGKVTIINSQLSVFPQREN